MTAYVVGIVAGAVCVVMPLIYAMALDRSVAVIMAQNPAQQVSFESAVPLSLLWAVFVVGALVLLLSAAMAAYAGPKRNRAAAPELESSIREEVQKSDPGAESGDDIELPEM